ncbi:TraV family lipoprotein, partial [Erwinia persicina]|uniref:TraV family lipoprotein n=1 Tax=Erwinia persicina TaxID=55211 RepID=UPI0017814E66|nr:TraV family lipoprotein [Erwinia persicina]
CPLKNDGHYFSGTGVCCTDGLIVTLTVKAASAPVSPSEYASAGRVNALRIPDATQRLWIAPWVDEQDSFHQPAVVEFVKEKSRWDEDFRVISDGE